MSSSSENTSSAAASDVQAPLLSPREEPTPDDTPTSPARPSTLFSLLGRASGRRGPSMLVRETAARELERRRTDWVYSKPVVALDMMWNSAFVVVSVVMLILTVDEHPNTPVRLWICVYAAQCLVHIVLVWVEYRNRTTRRIADEEWQQGSYYLNYSEDEEIIGTSRFSIRSSMFSVVKVCEYVNTMALFFWWIVGFYWVVSGGHALPHYAPRLYWSVVVFLALDVFFAIFCIVLTCLIAIALCCCLPCIIAILYAVAGQQGASDADLKILPKYKYQIANDGEKLVVGAGKMIPVETSSSCLADEHLLLPEDAECCICLSSYEDGVELNTLPCNHHFHSTCIVKWLKMNATCPLCKYNILKRSEEI